MFPLLRKYQLRRLFALLCIVSFTVCIWANAIPAHGLSAQVKNGESLVQIGVDQYQRGDFQSAIATWQQALDDVATDNLSHQSILLENLARAHRQIGQFSEEIAYWEQATQRYQQLGDLQALGRGLTEQAQAHNQLGQHRRALALLCGEQAHDCNQGSALHIAQAITDINGEAAALGSLGETYRLTGNYEQAITVLEQSLAVIGTDNPIYQAAVLNSLGNTYAALAQVSNRRAQAAAERGERKDANELTQKTNEQTQLAITFLQRSYEAAQAGKAISAQVRAQLNLIPLYQRLKRSADVSESWQTTRRLVAILPASQDKAFATLTLAGYLEPSTRTRQCPVPGIVAQQTQLLEDAIAIAKTIQSPRAQSFALGQLGNLYERCGDYEKALAVTRDARLAADQDRSAQDSLYLWAWQQGRILKAQGNPKAAAVAYAQSIEVLDTIRADILNSNQELQFDFRDRVEPIYQEYASLKLAEVNPSTLLAADSQSNVDSVLVTLDSLKLAELQNYFANDCIIAPTSKRVDVVGEQSATAVISTTILLNRTVVIASFPNGQRQIEWLETDENTLIEEVNEFRRTLERGRFRRVTYKAPAIKLYDQLLRPFEAQLKALQVDTLVFINDGILRSIPMAALYDGQQFLIEKFAVATTPSLTLTDPNTLDRNNLNALILGLSEESQVGNIQFGALAKVDDEITAVKAQLPNSTVLKNAEFSESNLRKALQAKSYRILHIATHGSFGAEPEDNYIVTGQKIDGQVNKALTIGELDALVRSVSSIDRAPIDLLALTACETAVGDNRATLGLAGVAVRAGVRSAIASLWAVDDKATADLITRFYHYLLDSNLSKAEALRAAQIEVIQAGGISQHPYYWAPFILIGNWL